MVPVKVPVKSALFMQSQAVPDRNSARWIAFLNTWRRGARLPRGERGEQGDPFEMIKAANGGGLYLLKSRY